MEGSAMKGTMRQPLLHRAATAFARDHDVAGVPPDDEESAVAHTDSYMVASNSSFSSQDTGLASGGSTGRLPKRAMSTLGVDRAVEATSKMKGKLKDRLNRAQSKFMDQTEDRHAIYSRGESRESQQTEKKTARRTSMPELQEHEVEARTSIGRPRAQSASDFEGSESRWKKFKRARRPSFMAMAGLNYSKANRPADQAVFARLGKNIQVGIAYMGIDWYQIQQRQQRLSWLFIVEHLYFWCYAGYIVTAILVGAVLLWALEPNGNLSFAQSVYSAAACVSQSGLAVVDWSKQSNSTYIISFTLIICGSASLMHTAPVLLRRLSFRMQTRMTLKLQERLERPSFDGPTPSSVTHSTRRFRRTSSDPGFFPDGSPRLYKNEEVVADLAEPGRSKRATLGTTVEVHEEVQRANGEFAVSKRFMELANQLTDKETSRKAWKSMQRQGKPKRTADHLSEMHRLEYKALGVVLRIMIGYWIVVHAIGWTIFFSYFEFGSGPMQDKFRREGYTSHWHATYLTASAFQNNGLVMTPSSVMDFRWSPLLLNTIGALVLCGNTCLPIAVRAIAWGLSRIAEKGSEEQRVLDFLLEHPRRCFTHMFPAVHTLWLLLVCMTLIMLQTAVMLWQDTEGPAFTWMDEKYERRLGYWDRFWNCLFTALATRTAGINSINIAELSQGTTFLIVVLMYFSTTPTVVTMRLSASSGGAGELDITGRAEGVDEEVLLGDNSLKTQARRYLTQDITYLICTLFLICVFEKHKFAVSAKEITPDSDGIYGDFSFFKVLFELVSAYGTCGFSLGYRNQTASFSGTWSEPSQYLLVVVMVLGRLRGLPDSIDPSVKVAMTQGEHTEHVFLHA